MKKKAELEKIIADSIVFGQGLYKIDPEGQITHIPLMDLTADDIAKLKEEFEKDLEGT